MFSRIPHGDFVPFVVCCVVTPYSFMRGYRRFGGTCCHYLLGWNVRRKLEI